MFDDLAAYFYENLADSYRAYLDVRNNESYGMSKDIRAGINAATALYHVQEHLPEHQRKTKKQITLECSDYGLLGDIANVSKHKTIDRNNPQITSAKQIEEAVVSTLYEDEEGLYTDTRKEVMAELDDGTKLRLVDMLTEVVNYWGNEFVRLGILENYLPFPSIPYPGNQFISRKDAERGMDTEIMRGVRFRQVIVLQKYNMQLGRAEPIPAKDIENLSFTVYEPSYFIRADLKLVSGEEYSLELESTEEESEKGHSLKTDEERQEFINNFVTERAEEINQLLVEAIESKDNMSTDIKQESKNTAIISSGKIKGIQ